MNLSEIKQKFNQTELLAIKRFLAFVNQSSANDYKFADDANLEQLNQFSEIADTDDEIKANVREYLRQKKVRLRGSQTNN